MLWYCRNATEAGQPEELKGNGLPLRFHSIKGRVEEGISEVADFVGAELTAVNGLVLYFQSKRRFPSWTSRVRVPSPAPSFQSLPRTSKNPESDRVH
jgi:hypothetical protein